MGQLLDIRATERGLELISDLEGQIRELKDTHYERVTLIWDELSALTMPLEKRLKGLQKRYLDAEKIRSDYLECVKVMNIMHRKWRVVRESEDEEHIEKMRGEFTEMYPYRAKLKSLLQTVVPDSPEADEHYGKKEELEAMLGGTWDDANA